MKNEEREVIHIDCLLFEIIDCLLFIIINKNGIKIKWKRIVKRIKSKRKAGDIRKANWARFLREKKARKFRVSIKNINK